MPDVSEFPTPPSPNIPAPISFDDRLRRILENADAPPRVIDRSILTLADNPPDAKALDECRNLTFLDPDRVPLLIILQGDKGTGKTVSGTRLLGFLANNRSAIEHRTATALWTSGFNLTNTVKYASGDAYIRTWLQFAKPDLLLIDDVFTEKITPTDAHLTAELIEERKNHYRTTIITTNKTPSDFEKISSRLSERLLEDAVIIAFSGSSRRLDNMR